MAQHHHSPRHSTQHSAQHSSPPKLKTTGSPHGARSPRHTLSPTRFTADGDGDVVDQEGDWQRGGDAADPPGLDARESLGPNAAALIQAAGMRDVWRVRSHQTAIVDHLNGLRTRPPPCAPPCSVRVDCVVQRCPCFLRADY